MIVAARASFSNAPNSGADCRDVGIESGCKKAVASPPKSIGVVGGTQVGVGHSEIGLRREKLRLKCADGALHSSDGGGEGHVRTPYRLRQVPILHLQRMHPIEAGLAARGRGRILEGR